MLQLLLPALIPSWRFFDRVGPAPAVEFALGRVADEPASEWHEVHPRPTRVSVGLMLTRVFWNPRWNEFLYLTSCAERLLDEPSPNRAAHLWMRVADIVRATHGAATTAGDRFLRVRVVEVTRAGDRLVRQVRFVSNAHRLYGADDGHTR